MPLPNELNDAKALLKRFEQAKKRRNGTWWSHMEEAYSYSAPQRETFFEYTPGQKKNTEIYDDTAVIGLQTFASRMQQSLVPPWQQWAKLVPGSEIPEEEAEGQIDFDGEQISLEEALEKITDIVFRYIHHSNFDSKAYEAFIDFGISTGVLTCEYDFDDDELVFDAVPLSQVFLEAGPRGTLDTMWRESEIECRLINQYWPDADIPDKIQKKIEKNPESKEGFVEGFVYNPKDKQTYYIVIGAKEIIYYQSEEVSPAVAFRGMVAPGENYGRGPVMQVLPTIKTLNLIKEFELTSGAIAASGAWTGVDDGVFNPFTVQIAPGIVIPVTSNDNSNPTLRALDMDFNFQFTQLKAEELQAVINRVLFANPIGDIDDPTKTATEITIRRQLSLQDQSAFFSRTQTELVARVLKRVVYVLQREGIIPKLKIDGKQIDIKHVSPIAKAMDMEDVQGVLQAIQMAGIVGPEMMLLGIKAEEVPGYIAEKMGVDPSLRRTDIEAAQLQQMVAQMIAQAQQQEEVPGA